MRKVTLRMNEQKKYEVIKKLVEINDNKKRAAVELECSLRTINRLILKYNTSGKKAFIHGNRNRKPAIGAIHGVYFDYQETLNGYYNVLYSILSDYGIPLFFDG